MKMNTIHVILITLQTIFVHTDKRYLLGSKSQTYVQTLKFATHGAI